MHEYRGVRRTSQYHGPEDIQRMEWNRSEVIGLARPKCSFCKGGGLRGGERRRPSPCNCVTRAIFRACYARFRYCASKEKYLSKITLDPCAGGKERRSSWGRKDEEYVADFTLIAKRTLSDREHRIFSYHYLLGADWKLCCRRLKMERGDMFHEFYRIEQKLGLAFREVQPYGLFPVDEYFGGSVRGAVTGRALMRPMQSAGESAAVPLRAPLRECA